MGYCQFIASMLGILLYSLSSKKIFSTFFFLFRVSPNEVQLTSRNSCWPCLFRNQYHARLLLWVICLNIVTSSSRRHFEKLDDAQPFGPILGIFYIWWFMGFSLCLQAIAGMNGQLQWLSLAMAQRSQNRWRIVGIDCMYSWFEKRDAMLFTEHKTNSRWTKSFTPIV